MLDYLRNLTKSKEEKRQKALNAYLDDALAPGQREQMEGDLAQNEALRIELDQMRLLKQQMGQLPQRRVRRNFVLDPALYGRPQREPLVQAYPLLRTATALAAFIFIFAVAATFFQNNTAGVMSDAEPAMMESEIREELIAEAVVEEEAPAASMVEGEAAEEPFMSLDMAVDSEFEMSDDGAEKPLGLLEMESEEALPLAGAASPERSKAEDLAQAESDLAAAPTLLPEPALATEPQTLPTAAVLEPDLPPGPPAAGGTNAADGGLFGADSLGLVVLFIGAALVILIVLTLLARRRL